METTTTKQELLNAINTELQLAYEDTLEEVLELLQIRRQQDEEDIKDIQSAKEDIKINGTVSWEDVKRGIA